MYMFVHVQSKFYLVWMLLVVNIVTSCPIGTDCGGSAPVVDFIDNQGALLCLSTGNYGTVRSRVAKHVSAILNVT